MDLYSEHSKSTWQKITILVAQIIFIVLSFWLLYPNGFQWPGAESSIKEISFFLFLLFHAITFSRFLLTLFVFIRRKIPLEEVFSVPMAFALYYAGFAVLARHSDSQSAAGAVTACLLFLSGGTFNTIAELQRHQWKKDPSHKGHLFTGGLFGLSRHPNYFGDVLWVSGYAFLSANVYSALIPAFLFCFFYFYNIPLLEKHLESSYKTEFLNYKSKVKSIIPFLL